MDNESGLRELTIRRFDNDLRAAVDFLSYLEVRTPIFPTLYTPGYFRWKIAENPFGPSACYVRFRDGVPAAHCSIVAKPLNTAMGIGAGCGELGDTHTHPNFQRQGHFGVLGSHVIQEFDRTEPPGAKLIYGLPNDQALPGWTRRCGCEVFEALGVVEMWRDAWNRPWAAAGEGFRWIWRKIRRADSGLQMCSDPERTAGEIDRLWARVEGQGRYLIKKDGAWWLWRYQRSPERYSTYARRDPDTRELLAYVTAKVGRWRLRYVHICDVMGQTPALAVEAFVMFLDSLVLPTDRVIVWTQEGMPLHDVARQGGFRPVRVVPVIFFKNDAYQRLKDSGLRIHLALGDTDNA